MGGAYSSSSDEESDNHVLDGNNGDDDDDDNDDDDDDGSSRNYNPFVSSSGRNPYLFRLMYRDEWAKVRDLLRDQPDVTRTVDTYRRTPLHVVVVRCPPVMVMGLVRTLLHIDPGAASTRDCFGLTPLHYASWKGHSDEAMKVLIEACPEALHMEDSSGRIPLHFSATAANTKILLQHSPSDLTKQDTEGISPIANACGYCAEMISSMACTLSSIRYFCVVHESDVYDPLVLHDFDSCGVRRYENLGEAYDVAGVLIDAAYTSRRSTHNTTERDDGEADNDSTGDEKPNGVGNAKASSKETPSWETTKPSSPSPPPVSNNGSNDSASAIPSSSSPSPAPLLHSSLWCNECPIQFCELLLRLHPSQIKEMDAEGNYPLHLASRIMDNQSWSERVRNINLFPDSFTTKRGGLRQHTDTLEGLITNIAREYPEAAQKTNTEGYVPLQIMDQTGMTWKAGFVPVLDAYPSALQKLNVSQKTLPKVLYKVGRDCQFNTMFEIMKEHPDLFQYARALRRSSRKRKRIHDNL